MEPLLVVLCEGLFCRRDLIFTLSFFSPFEVAHRRHVRDWPLWRVFLWAGAGGIATGLLSLILIEHVLVQSSWLRVANLVVIPILGGWINYKIAKAPNVLEPERHFWGAVVFAFLFNAIRFAFATR